MLQRRLVNALSQPPLQSYLRLPLQLRFQQQRQQLPTAKLFTSTTFKPPATTKQTLANFTTTLGLRPGTMKTPAISNATRLGGNGTFITP